MLHSTFLAGALIIAPFPSGQVESAFTSISGTVADSAGEPIARVLVYVDAATHFGFTDSTGAFRLTRLPAGEHRVHFRKTGFAPRTFDFVLSGDTMEGSIGTVVLQKGLPPTVSIGGTITDSMAKAPLQGAQVVLNGAVLAETDERGEFSVGPRPVAWGTNFISVRRIGYKPLADLLWIDKTRTTLDLSVKLTPVGVRLPEVIVEGRRLGGFWERSRTDRGRYFTREDIEARDPIFTTDLFKEVPGVTVRRSVAVGAEVFFLRRGGRCRPIIWVNGLRLLGSVDIDTYTPPDRIEGIEIYSATPPPQFDPTMSGCGVIVIWTR